MNALSFTVHTPDGPQQVEAVEDWSPQPRRGSVTAARFKLHYKGQGRRLYSDSTPGLERPHFIWYKGKKLEVSGVCP